MRSAAESATGSEACCLDAQQRQVDLGINADHLGRELALVAQGDDDLVGALGDVMVGENIAPGGIDDHTGAKAVLLAFTAMRLRHTKETPEKRVIQQRVVFIRADPRLRGDVHHRRQYRLQHRGDAVGRWGRFCHGSLQITRCQCQQQGGGQLKCPHPGPDRV